MSSLIRVGWRALTMPGKCVLMKPILYCLRLFARKDQAIDRHRCHYIIEYSSCHPIPYRTLARLGAYPLPWPQFCVFFSATSRCKPFQQTNLFGSLCCSFLFSAGLLYEVDKLSGMILARSESKARRHWAQERRYWYIYVWWLICRSNRRPHCATPSSSSGSEPIFSCFVRHYIGALILNPGRFRAPRSHSDVVWSVD